MKTNLFLTVIASFLCVISTSCKSKQEVAKQDQELREKVALYMQGKPVNCLDFPWCQSNNMPDRSVLKVYLERGLITHEELEVLSRPVTCWVRESPESK